MSVQVQSALPIELERPIFELAAQVDRKSAQNLVCVAKRVKDWIDPIFYSKVYLLDSADSHTKRGTGPSSLVRFMGPLNKRPSQFFTQNIQHICLCSNTAVELSLVQSILSQCTNVVTLAYGGAVPTWDHALSILRSSKLRRLTMELPPSAPTEAQATQLHPPLKNITHLDVLGQWPHPDTLDILPSLTHIAIDFEEKDDKPFPLLSKLSNNTSIEIVTFIVHDKLYLEDDVTASICGIEDRRFVPVLFQLEKVQDDWLASTSGGKDMWYRAEQAIRSRAEAILWYNWDAGIQADVEIGRQLEELGASIRLCQVSH